MLPIMGVWMNDRMAPLFGGHVSQKALASHFTDLCVVMAQYKAQFIELLKKDVDEQCQFFLKSFIFALDNDWKEVIELSKRFAKYIVLAQQDEPDVTDLNAAQAADFLQQNGKTRTGTQRREELKDVDINMDDRISFLEYLLLHYKGMILREYYKRHKMTPEEDLSNDAIGTFRIFVTYSLFTHTRSPFLICPHYSLTYLS